MHRAVFLSTSESATYLAQVCALDRKEQCFLLAGHAERLVTGEFMLTLSDRQFVLAGGIISATLEDPHWVARYDGPRDPRLFWSIRFDTEGREFDSVTIKLQRARSPPVSHCAGVDSCPTGSA